MRIGVTGASGMLGTALLRCLSKKKYEVFATSRSNGAQFSNVKWDLFDLCDFTLLNEWLQKIKPDVVIHCAAIVNVDACEENISLATKVHVESTQVIASYLTSNCGRLIYISTDSVFDGEKQDAYTETYLANPLNVYSKTKLLGERHVESMDNGLVLRVNIVGTTKISSSSFAEWLLAGLIDKVPLNLFYDVYFSPLHVVDLSFIIGEIIEKPMCGVYHCASKNSISKYEFGMMMAKIFQLSNLNLNKVSVESVNFKAKRPKNMALDVKKISSALGRDLPSVVDTLTLMKRILDDNDNSVGGEK